MQPIITTFTGKNICPLNIQSEDFDLEDIARGLSNTCRFGGQLSHFYSVSQHSVLCENIARSLYPSADRRLWLACLAHDFAETYLSDFPTPIKGNVAISTLPHGKIMTISELENKILEVFQQRFLCPLDFNDKRVHYVDKVALNSESFYLRGFRIFEDKYPILKEEIVPLQPREAYVQFCDTIRLYYDLLSI